MAHAHTNGAGDDGHHGLSHIMPVPVLLAVFFALLGLTFLTTWVSANVELGDYELFFSMGIASVKAGLVLAFFMHMLYDKAFNVAIIFFSLIFVSLFVGFTLLDRSEYDDQIREAEYETIRLEEAN